VILSASNLTVAELLASITPKETEETSPNSTSVLATKSVIVTL
jgi:hypothetical protein